MTTYAILLNKNIKHKKKKLLLKAVRL